MSLAGLSSARPSSLAQLTDPSGRELSTLPSALAHHLLAVDQILRDYGMTFNIVCEECVRRIAPPGSNPDAADRRAMLVMPQEREGHIEFVCAHARRQSLLTAKGSNEY